MLENNLVRIIKMKRVILLLLLLILLPNAIASVSIEAVKSTIVIGTNQQAKYLINIKNENNYTETFELYLKDLSWDVMSDPLADYVGGGVTLKPGEDYVVNLFLKPKYPAKMNIGSYSLPLIITEQKSHKQENVILNVDIVSGQPSFKEYAIAVQSSLTFPAKIDPRQENTLNIYVSNSFPRDIKNLKVNVKSQIFNVEKYIDLGPLDNANLKFKVSIDPYTKPVSDVMKVTFSINNKTISDAHQSYHIIGYSELKKTNETIVKKFLSREIKFTYFNDGNIKNSQSVYYPENKFKRMFTKSLPPYYLVSKRDGEFLAWDLVLEPQGKQEIVIIQNYKAPFIILLAILFFILLYYLFRSQIVIEKSIKLLEIKDGAVSELKVLIHIKNRSNSKLTSIKIGDRVPGLVTVEKEFDVGTIQPTKIVKDGKGSTILRWEIGELDPYEERIITYKVKARLKVVGDFVLPSALVKFRTPSRSELKTKSGLGRISQ